MGEPSMRELRTIVAKNQVRLGVGRGLRLALAGMSYRMFRSSVTMAILALATAFLVHMLSFGLVQQGTERNAFAELSRQRHIGQTMTRLTEIDDDTKVVDGLASGESSRLSEYRRWSKQGEHEVMQSVLTARRLRTAAKSLNDLPAAARAVLLGDAKPEEFVLNLGPQKLAEIEAQARQLSVRLPLGSEVEFRRFVAALLPNLRAFVSAVREGHRHAIQHLTQSFAGKAISEVIRDRAPELPERLKEVGYELLPADLEDLSKLERRTTDIASLNRVLQNGEIATEIGRLASIETSRVNFETVSSFVTNAARARELHEVLARAKNQGLLTEARLLQLAAERNREVKVTRALGESTLAYEPGKFGLSERNQWLVALSFLVCIIGVANAMLMSVTERFTEIATMKCLGAMDGFVMMVFVFEAMIQGVVGGLVGLVVGVLLALLRAAVEYGSLFWSASSVVTPVLWSMAFSLLVSVLLAALAAVGPSWLAARLSPMEAMRVD